MWQDGALTQLTGDDFTVGSAAWCPACRKVFFAGAGFTILRPFFLGIWSLDLETMESRALVPEGKYMVSNIALVGGRVVVAASLQEGNPAAKTTDLYILDTQDGTMRLLCGGGLSFGNTVMTDCRFAGGREFAVWEDKLYFTATVDEYAHLLCCDLKGTLTTIVGGEGCVDGFALCAGGVYFVGLRGQCPHELYFRSWDGEEQLISDFNGSFFREKELTRPQPVSFLNENGDEIRGFVLPPMTDALAQQGRCPAILDIHGGPLGAYGPVYFHEMQYWAAHGYYVMFCNPTGSTGRGQAFCDICGDSGGTDYRDLMSFVDTVLAQYPAIDSDRLGVPTRMVLFKGEHHGLSRCGRPRNRLRHGVKVISDEIRCDLVYHPHVHIPFASLSPQLAKISVTATAPSKSFNIAGLTVSNLVVQDEGIMKQISAIAERDMFKYINKFGFAGCTAAYTLCEDWLEEVLHVLHDNACYVRDWMRVHFPDVKIFELEGTYLQWADFSPFGADPVQRGEFLIRQARFYSNTGEQFGAEYGQYQRFNLACPRRYLTAALERLKAASH